MSARDEEERLPLVDFLEGQITAMLRDDVPEAGRRVALGKSIARELLLALRDNGLEVKKETRCPICDWPYAENAEQGCVPGNCSYRPEPGTPEHERITRNRALLKAGEKK